MNSDLQIRLTPFKDSHTGRGSFWATLVRELTKEVKGAYTVVVTVRKIIEKGDDTGFLTFDGSFHIILDDRMPFGMVTDYLIHELAHAGSWHVTEPEDHGPHFGIEYAKLYRRYLELYTDHWGC